MRDSKVVARENRNQQYLTRAPNTIYRYLEFHVQKPCNCSHVVSAPNPSIYARQAPHYVNQNSTKPNRNKNRFANDSRHVSVGRRFYRVSFYSAYNVRVCQLYKQRHTKVTEWISRTFRSCGMTERRNCGKLFELDTLSQWQLCAVVNCAS